MFKYTKFEVHKLNNFIPQIWIQQANESSDKKMLNAWKFQDKKSK